MAESQEQEIRVRAERAIAEKVFPGCVIGIITSARYCSLTPVHEQSTVLKVVPVGHLTYDKSQSVQEDTIYDLASVTKSIPVASLALTLAAENPPRLNLGERVKEYLPELQNDYGATIEDLLRYRVMGRRMSRLEMTTFEEIRTAMLEHGFNGWPGHEIYTNAPAFFLGLILERITGQSLPALAHKYFFEPLGMTDTTFFPHDKERIAPTEIVDGDLPAQAGEIRGIVHDESDRIFSRARRAVGHAGLFSTVPDLLKFLGALLNVGHPMSYIVEGAQKGLGWEVDKEWMGEKRGPKTFGKTGFTGTSVLCDIEKGIGLVILSNRTYPHRPDDNSAINAFRKDIADIVFG